MPKTPQTKGERTRARIMDAAEELFARQGFQATTLREIAEAASLREPGLYNHFAGKDALYEAVLDRSLQPLETLITAHHADAFTPAAAMAMVGELLRLLARHPPMSALFYQAIQSFSGDNAASAAAQRILRLFTKGRGLNRQVMPGDEDTIVLQGIALFNLCCGYFLAQPLMRELAGIDALAPTTLDAQQRVMERAMRAFLIG